MHSFLSHSCESLPGGGWDIIGPMGAAGLQSWRCASVCLCKSRKWTGSSFNCPQFKWMQPDLVEGDFCSIFGKYRIIVYIFKEELQSAHIICNKNIFAILKLPSNHFAFFLYILWLCTCQIRCRNLPPLSLAASILTVGSWSCCLFTSWIYTETHLHLSSSRWLFCGSSHLPSCQTLMRVRERELCTMS